MTINNSFLLDLRSHLDKNKHFGSTDFIITTEKRNLILTYAYNDAYSFNLYIPYETSKLTKKEKSSTTLGLQTTHNEIEYYEYEFFGYMKPGNFAVEEKVNFEGTNAIWKYINSWLGNLWKEITIQPELRRVNDIENELKKINEKFDNISEDNFSKDEISKIIEKLDNLEQQFKEKLEEEIQDKEILKKTLTELHIEIEKLKEQSKILNKKNWFKSFGGKIFTWVSKEDNRKFLKDSAEFIKPLLPESIDNII